MIWAIMGLFGRQWNHAPRQVPLAGRLNCLLTTSALKEWLRFWRQQRACVPGASRAIGRLRHRGHRDRRHAKPRRMLPEKAAKRGRTPFGTAPSVAGSLLIIPVRRIDDLEIPGLVTGDQRDGCKGAFMSASLPSDGSRAVRVTATCQPSGQPLTTSYYFGIPRTRGGLYLFYLFMTRTTPDGGRENAERADEDIRKASYQTVNGRPAIERQQLAARAGSSRRGKSTRPIHLPPHRLHRARRLLVPRCASELCGKIGGTWRRALALFRDRRRRSRDAPV